MPPNSEKWGSPYSNTHIRSFLRSTGRLTDLNFEIHGLACLVSYWEMNLSNLALDLAGSIGHFWTLQFTISRDEVWLLYLALGTILITPSPLFSWTATVVLTASPISFSTPLMLRLEGRETLGWIGFALFTLLLTWSAYLAFSRASNLNFQKHSYWHTTKTKTGSESYPLTHLSWYYYRDDGAA